MARVTATDIVGIIKVVKFVQSACYKRRYIEQNRYIKRTITIYSNKCIVAGANLKDITPVPPPRRKKRNRSRPLPPKPDEIPENVTNNLKHGDTSEEPLYFSVRSSKTSNNNQNGEVGTWGTEKTCTEDPKHDGRKTKEIYEHKAS